MHFTLRQLEIFAAIARSGSVSGAAGAVALTQSAASTALAELERQTGRRLFDRVGKSLRLNELGRNLLPKAVELLDRAAEIDDLLQGHEAVGNLNIGATLTIGNYLATLIVAEFLRRHPQARVKLEVRNTAHLLQALAVHEVDLGLVEGDCHHPDLAVVPWVDDELAVFCAPGHPLAGRSATPKRLLQEPWILREPGSGTRETFDHAFRHHLPGLRVRLELEHTEAIKRAVESGLGLGCISRLALKDAFRRGSLAEVRTPALDLKRTFSFVWHRDKFHGAGLRAFLELCREFSQGAATSDEIALPPVP
ncbi:LysR family transcriptional regulator [Azospira restricta]|uniref:LysR family transcriptional regulator n=1 Tax=Azospira restricta TaxID=404405 RepID=A0A974PWM7_9RHOO|nr:LysR family transcriptional regulator [Azospira restricta]QRJ62671.1 LysR family transcriptional regulator [Azospira restricta]